MKGRRTKLDNKQVKVAIGGMLHDIGKVLYRYNDGRNHSTSGYDFLKSQGITDNEILSQVKFHHAAMLKGAEIPNDSLAYITYWADNVAAGADRRDKEDIDGKYKFEKFVPLESVFNILNSNHQHFSYNMARIYDNGEPNYPNEKKGEYLEETYGQILEKIKEGLNQIELTDAYVNSLLGVLEANLSYIPSSTDVTQVVDISLFDHLKVTASIGSCLYEYLNANNIDNYKEALRGQEKEYYEKDCFLLFSLDISGIQDFIYSVHSEGALKTLRAKSFYLEIMLEHIIDELLEQVDVSRANLIYSGGGHGYILLPNTDKVKTILSEFEEKLTNWYIENFRTDLFVACGYSACSANDLMNKPSGAYKELFISVSKELSKKKASRYSATQLIRLNNSMTGENDRECKVCGSVDKLINDDICQFCDSFKKLSSSIINDSFITVLSTPENKAGIKLPFDYYMVMESADELRNHAKNNENYVRSYSKNKMFTGYNISTKLWVGDYNNGDSFEELANRAKGVNKLGVLRADVDNLGQAFVSGFERDDDSQQYVSISRTATFSRKLNMFFKLHINYILGNGQYTLNGGKLKDTKRNALVVYSGGDDLFIVGPWNEIIEAAVDINNALKKYTQGTLTMSAGIGIFPPKYPVKALARQTGVLEDAAKDLPGKDGITLFTANKLEHTYKWEDFKSLVIGEKFKLINEYFTEMQDKGMSTIYNLLNYIRNLDDTINLARLAYMLGRMEPDKLDSEDRKTLYRRFSSQFYKWVTGEKAEENRKELITAIYLYVYLNRESKEGKNGETK